MKKKLKIKRRKKRSDFALGYSLGAGWDRAPKKRIAKKKAKKRRRSSDFLLGYGVAQNKIFPSY